MEHFSSKPADVLKALEVDPAQGLSAAEAEKRLGRYGANVLAEKKKKTNLQRFFDQFKDAMILILIAAAVVSFVVACVEGNPGEFFEPALILLIVILNAVMGVLQESKAEKALDALKGLSAPHARVLRGGAEQVVEAAALVPGDIIRLEAGDFVPADARLLQSAGKRHVVAHEIFIIGGHGLFVPGQRRKVLFHHGLFARRVQHGQAVLRLVPGHGRRGLHARKEGLAQRFIQRIYPFAQLFQRLHVRRHPFTVIICCIIAHTGAPRKTNCRFGAAPPGRPGARHRQRARAV